MHRLAVGADRTLEPVRSFGTFTTDSTSVVDWFHRVWRRDASASWNRKSS